MRRVITLEFGDNELELYEKLNRLKDSHFRTQQGELKSLIEQAEE